MTEPERPGRPDRVGTIDGESVHLTSHTLDPKSGEITLSAVVRGSRALERLQHAMTGARVAVTLPNDSLTYATLPVATDVSTTGSGERALHRLHLTLRLVEHEQEDEASRSKTTADTSELSERLDRIEAKVDRILAMLDMQNDP